MRNLKDVAVIIDIFSRNTLNTTKHLNFIDFKLAYDIYTNKDKGGADNIIARILAIKCQMNKNRTNFDLGQDHVINITLDWFIGFLEGEGCFNYSPDKNLFSFVVVQKENLPLMIGIRDFLNNRSNISLNLVDSTEELAARVYSGKADSKGQIVNDIKVRQLDFITKVLIPLLDSANWRSKKEKDYKDWKALINIVELGLHYTDEGKLIIERILAQMNNNRLSTNKTHSDEDRALLLSDISLLISKGSNYINQDGKIFIKSLNRLFSTNKKVAVEVVEVSSGEVLDTFNSVSELANKLEINLQTAHYRVKNISKFTCSRYNEKLVYIKKIVN
uniref:LAGLIDADG endonuclease n=1 Tax=Chrysoporthe austroafricana TaxID=354353 RepID=A0A191MWJ4_9PEZI|nr:LAGLIDADG endonuclease [Chrysoporthe austroafricana]AMX22056.1 LAGLIDADG endonuclease [Chrysoporthe austroafricana]